MDTPSMEMLGLVVKEPMTLLTDVFITFACLAFARRISSDVSSDPVRRSWSLFFLLMGISTLAGGLSHGFPDLYGTTMRLGCWLFSGAAVYFAEVASIRGAPLRPVTRKFLLGFAAIQWIGMTTAVLLTRTFLAVKINSAIGFVGIVLLLHVYRYVRGREPGMVLVASGVLLSSATIVIHGLKISPHSWFNYNDLSHIILILCFYLLYAGARESGNLQDVPSTACSAGRHLPMAGQ